MDYITLCLSSPDESFAQDDLHKLGNFADDIWRERFALEHGEVRDGKYFGRMLILGQPFRTKDRKNLNRLISEYTKAYAKTYSTKLDIEIID